MTITLQALLSSPVWQMAIESSSLTVCFSLSSSLFPLSVVSLLSVSFSVLPPTSPSFFCFFYLFWSVSTFPVIPFVFPGFSFRYLFLSHFIFALYFICPLFVYCFSSSCFFSTISFCLLLPILYFLLFVSFYLSLHTHTHTHTHTHINLAMVQTPEQLAFNFRQGQRFSLLRVHTRREATQPASHSVPQRGIFLKIYGKVRTVS